MTCTGLLTAAALLVALAPCAPRRHRAMPHTRRRVAHLRGRQGVAFCAAVGGRGDFCAKAAVHTAAARLRARTPVAPLGEHAIDGAWMAVACFTLGERRAGQATVCGGHNDATRLGPQAVTAFLRARAKCTKTRNLAIHRARSSITVLGLGQVAAGSAATGRSPHHGARARMHPSAARAVACAPIAPLGGLTIAFLIVIEALRAVVRVARLDLCARARDASIAGIRDDDRRPRLGSDAAVLRARAPRSPAALVAVNGAVVGATRLCVHGVATRTTVFGRRDLGAFAHASANTARDGASAPFRPCSVHAIDRARHRIARRPVNQ